MGFQTSDLNEFARQLLALAGVTRAYIRAADDRDATLWILVGGFDEVAHGNRIRVRQAVEAFVSDHRHEMGFSGFVFDYHVLVDDDSFGPAHVPAGAREVAAA